MLSIRSFRNSDPPKMVEIWRRFISKEPQKVAPLSLSGLLENVLCLPFFESRGLFLALEDGFPVGFAHASFGPNRDQSDVNPETGVIHLVMTVPAYPNSREVNRRLLEHCEEYLKSQGAKVIFGGPPRSSASFYTGLYGGSEPIGVYGCDEALIAAYQELGYHTLYNTLRFTYDLKNFQIPFTPKSVGWKKKLIVNYSDKPPAENWFQACTTTRFVWFNATATLGQQGEKLAKIHFRGVPGHNFQIPPTAALVHFQVADAFLHQGIGTFLFGETVRRLVTEFHPCRIETIVMKEESFALFLRKLGWKEENQGKVFLKILQERRKEHRSEG